VFIGMLFNALGPKVRILELIVAIVVVLFGDAVVSMIIRTLSLKRLHSCWWEIRNDTHVWTPRKVRVHATQLGCLGGRVLFCYMNNLIRPRN